MATKPVRRSFGRLWKEYLRDSTQWWDNRKSKVGLAHPYPDFKHKFTKESLWVDGCCNPSWVGEELRRTGLAASSLVRHGELCADNEQELLCEATSFVTLLRTCAKNKDLYRGTRLHNDVLKRGLLEQCSDALVTMYAKC
eukprot:c24248_g7_i1 orf=227-646(+)